MEARLLFQAKDFSTYFYFEDQILFLKLNHQVVYWHNIKGCYKSYELTYKI